MTSVAINDSGLFNPDPKDPRYLPFERRGAISRWHLKLTAQVWRQLDWESITEVTLHMRYTSQVDAAQVSTIQDSVATTLADLPFGYSSFGSALFDGLPVAFSAKRDAPDAWFVAQNTETDATFVLELKEGMIPTVGTLVFTRVLVGVIQTGTIVPVTLDEALWTEGTAPSPFTLWTKNSGSLTTDSTITITHSSFSTMTDLLVILLP